MINTVGIPRGTSREYIDRTANKQESDYNRWVSISDTRNLKYYICGYPSRLLFLVDFNSILSSYSSNSEDLNDLKTDIPTGDLVINSNESIYKALTVVLKIFD